VHPPTPAGHRTDSPRPRPACSFPAGGSLSKEDLALHIAQRDGIKQGLIAVFRAVENCWSFNVGYDNRFLHLRSGPRKCLHYYHYFLDPDFGLLYARVQSWLPFTIHVGLNGRRWLARQLDRAGIHYEQRDNCFADVADFRKAQALLDGQVHYDWAGRLDQLLPRVQPALAAIFGRKPVDYYWSVDESEWATDIAFARPADLASLYPRLVRHGIATLSCEDVLRFLGRKQPAQCASAAVVGSCRRRPQGLCLKYRVNDNVLKMYDKQQSVLRVETVINNAEDFKVYRRVEGKEDGPKQWLKMRKGVVDMPRRAEVAQAANERYLEALAVVEEPTVLGELAAAVCRPRRWHKQRVRALNPLTAADSRLLSAVNRGEFAVCGFRNRDLRPHLFDAAAVSAQQQRRQSAAVTRQLRLLRAHGLIHKVAHEHRYQVSQRGRQLITALLAAQKSDVKRLLTAC
jgi:hypothetical protein